MSESVHSLRIYCLIQLSYSLAGRHLQSFGTCWAFQSDQTDLSFYLNSAGSKTIQGCFRAGPFFASSQFCVILSILQYVMSMSGEGFKKIEAKLYF